MTDEICPVCGDRNPPRTTFCQNCNSYLGWDTAEPDEPPKSGEPVSSPDASADDGSDRQRSDRTGSAPRRPPVQPHDGQQSDRTGSVPRRPPDEPPDHQPRREAQQPPGPQDQEERAPSQSDDRSAQRTAVRDTAVFRRPVSTPSAPSWRPLRGEQRDRTPRPTWDPVRSKPPSATSPSSPRTAAPHRQSEAPPRVAQESSPEAPERHTPPRHPQTPARDTGAPPTEHPDPATNLRAEVHQQEVVVTPGAGPAVVPVRVANTSTIVEAYDVTLVGPPPWLQVAPGEARLLPGTDDELRLTLSIDAEDLVPVQRLPLQLRVQARSTQELRTHADIDVVVGAVEGPVTLELEPTTVRARDATMAMFRVVVDNRRSNEPLTVDLAGEDAEHAARFGFSRTRLEVPPAGTAESRLRVDAPLPEPGEQLTRTLTVSASDGSTTLEVFGTFMQIASSTVVDPPVNLRLNPNTVRAGRSGRTVVLADNRRGTQPQRLTLSAHDDEGAVRFRISPVDLEVPAGQTGSARLEMQAPRPDSGEEVTRPITVTAWNGRESVEAEGSLVQHAPDRRPLFRALATIAGAVLMILGAFMHWTTVPVRLRGTEWGVGEVIIIFNLDQSPNVRQVQEFLQTPGVGALVDPVVNPGIIIILLALVAVLGLVGATGRLTRLAAALAALFVIASFLALVVGGVVERGGALAVSGRALVVLLLGCVVALVGGMLARR